jgi:hypothetical protein
MTMKKSLSSFEDDVRESLTRIEQQSSNIENYIEQRVEQERSKSDAKYAPIILWTGALAVLSMFGVAIITKLIALIGI